MLKVPHPLSHGPWRTSRSNTCALPRNSFEIFPGAVPISLPHLSPPNTIQNNSQPKKSFHPEMVVITLILRSYMPVATYCKKKIMHWDWDREKPESTCNFYNIHHMNNFFRLGCRNILVYWTHTLHVGNLSSMTITITSPESFWEKYTSIELWVVSEHHQMWL